MRVRFKRPVERYPHFIVREGETGTVTHLDFNEGDNECIWYNDWELDDLDQDLEILT